MIRSVGLFVGCFLAFAYADDLYVRVVFWVFGDLRGWTHPKWIRVGSRSVLRPGDGVRNAIVALNDDSCWSTVFCVEEAGGESPVEVRASHSASIPSTLTLSLFRGPSRGGSVNGKVEGEDKVRISAESEGLVPSFDQGLSALIESGRVCRSESGYGGSLSMGLLKSVHTREFSTCDFVVVVEAKQRGPSSVSEPVFVPFNIVLDPLMWNVVPSSLLSLLRPAVALVLLGAGIGSWLLSDDAPCSNINIETAVADDPLDTGTNVVQISDDLSRSPKTAKPSEQDEPDDGFYTRAVLLSTPRRTLSFREANIRRTQQRSKSLVRKRATSRSRARRT